ATVNVEPPANTIDNVTLSPAIGLPLASCTCPATGIVAPATALVGSVEKLIADGAPTLMLNGLLVVPVRPALAALSVYPVPPLFNFKLLNVATPATALTVVVPLSVAPPGLVPIEIVTAAVLLVTTLPLASCTCTVTAGVMAVPATAFDGCCANASLVAAA